MITTGLLRWRIPLLTMLASGFIAASCSDDTAAGGTTRSTDGVADTTITGSGGEVRLRRTEQIEDITLAHTPTSLYETWRWVGIGDDANGYKPLFPWHGSFLYSIAFNADGRADMHCGINGGVGIYHLEGSSVVFDTFGFEMMGSLSKAHIVYDHFFMEFLSQKLTYSIDTRGMLRLYYSDTEYLSFVAASAAGGSGTANPATEQCFGKWRFVGAYYANGAFVSDGGGEVLFGNDYTMITSGGGNVVVPSIAPGRHCFDYESGAMVVATQGYDVTIDGDRMYLCGGIDLTSPTIILEREDDTPGTGFGNRIQRDGFHVELFLTDSAGVRQERFRCGQNIVFNVAITNECDTAITLPAQNSIFHSRRPPLMIYKTDPGKTMQLANQGQDAPRQPTTLAPHATMLWQSPLYAGRGIEATPPLGKPTLGTMLDEGRYYTELYLMLGGRYAVKMTHYFTISQIADGITDIRLN